MRTRSPKRRVLEFWCTVVVLAVLAYPISFGPACWISSRTNAGTDLLPTVYRPITSALSVESFQLTSVEGVLARTHTAAGMFRVPARDGAVTWYAKLGAPEGWNWMYAVTIRQTPDGTFDTTGHWTWRSK